MLDVINQEVIDQRHELAAGFSSADPFKHVLIENFLRPEFLDGILGEFPVPDQEQMRSEFGRVSRKHAVHDIVELGPTFRRWDAVLKSSEFIRWLETVTGCEQLLFDPEYHGAGTHNNMSGQGMDTHIDFNLHRTTGYHRRINLIIYLCPEWDPAWGGNIRLHKNPWSPEEDYHREYPPFLNHAVLFETNEYSWHGFEQINIPPEKADISRKSLTVYYYSTSRPEEEIAPKHGTIYVPKGMPEEIKPGAVITPEVFDKLKINFRRRDQFLQGLYKRESDLLVQIERLKKQLRHLREGGGRTDDQSTARGPGSGKSSGEGQDTAKKRRWQLPFFRRG